jgi:hypothetical protein
MPDTKKSRFLNVVSVPITSNPYSNRIGRSSAA